MSVHVVVMGVSGCGKTTVAEAVRDRLGFTMVEGDSLHSAENVAKMRAGIPLTDEDRWPWLKSINQWMLDEEAAGRSTVISCSALKRAYRDILRKDVPVFFVHMVGSQELIAGRMAKRQGHYMPPSLLPSQFATLENLEADEPGAVVPIDGTSEAMIELVIAAICEHAASEARAD